MKHSLTLTKSFYSCKTGKAYVEVLESLEKTSKKCIARYVFKKVFNRS